MSPPEDESLREAFRSMARHDARKTPEFQALRARAQPRHTWRVVAPVGSALALAACLLLVFGANLSKRDLPSSSAVAPPAASVATLESAHGASSEPAAAAEAPGAVAGIIVRERELGLDPAQLSKLRALDEEGRSEQLALEAKRTMAQRQLAAVLGRKPLDAAEATRLGRAVRSFDLQLESLDRARGARAQEVLTARQRLLLASSFADAGVLVDGGR